MLVFEREGCLIAFPVLVRDIDIAPALGIGGAWKDVTSVYGYAGPVSSVAVIPAQAKEHFTGFVNEFLRGNCVVCACSRLHPLLEQSLMLSGCGQVVELGCTLSIDLTLPEDEQWRAYRRNHRQDIQRLQSMGVTCEETGPERMDEFVEMYYETMDRKGATREYYFTRAHFEYLLGGMGDKVHLLIARHEGRALAGGLFTLCCGIVQWHLSGSHAGQLEGRATKLVLDTARRWAQNLGARTLHLGGGLGGSRDSLHHFKRGFGSREHPYRMWRHISNPDMYAELCRAASGSASVDLTVPFFPVYRDPLLHSRRI